MLIMFTLPLLLRSAIGLRTKPARSRTAWVSIEALTRDAAGLCHGKSAVV